MQHRDLPGARDEAERLHHLLGQEPALRSDLLGSDMDLDTFLDRIGSAHLIHFAGHGTYDEHDPASSGLVFDHGTLTGQMLVGNLEGDPIVFGNACQSGILTQVTSEGVAAGWSGLAAAFIASGAVNYLGSLWPVFDEASRHVAVEFYRRLCRGIPVGEALRLARSDAYSDHDPTWAAYVLFGCPRNRLRPEGPRS
jgi:CHAT domain-containing protein